MTSRSTTLLAALLAFGLVTGVTIPEASAQASEPFLEDVLDDEEDSIAPVDLPSLETLQSVGVGLQARAGFWISQTIPSWVPGASSSTASAESVATNVTDYYNAHNGTLETWINQRTNATTSHNVVEITWSIEGETATRYLVATVSNNNYTDTKMVNDTSKTVDDTVALCGLAADRSDEELETFHDRFASPDENLTRPYVARLGSTYKSDVSTTLLPATDGCEVGA